MDTFVDIRSTKRKKEKWGGEGGREREREGEGAKNRTVPIQGDRARFLRKFHVSGQGTFSIYPAQIE